MLRSYCTGPCYFRGRGCWLALAVARTSNLQRLLQHGFQLFYLLIFVHTCTVPDFAHESNFCSGILISNLGRLHENGGKLRSRPPVRAMKRAEATLFFPRCVLASGAKAGIFLVGVGNPMCD